VCFKLFPVGRFIMECNHSNIEIDRAEKVYRCSACGTVVGHFLTVAEQQERKSEIEQYGRKLKGLVSIGNGLYARTKAR
jgi:uncharacterized Zn finger protein